MKNENVSVTVGCLHKALGIQYDLGMIDACHRLKRNVKSGQPKPIIVKYVSRLKKDEVINARKVKRSLCLRDLNIPTEPTTNMETPGTGGTECYCRSVGSLEKRKM